MSVVKTTGKTMISLGRQGENLVRQVIFDLSEYIQVYGDGIAELIHQRPGDEAPSPVAAVREGSTLVWTVSKLDTEVRGTGCCELRWYVEEALAKSQMWQTSVERSMETPAETVPPAAEQGWVEQVLDAAVQAKTAAHKAATSAVKQPYPDTETGTWWVWDAEQQQYTDTGYPASGGNDDIDALTQRLSKLEMLLKEIQEKLNSGTVASETVAQINDMIVSYFENKTVAEVEG